MATRSVSRSFSPKGSAPPGKTARKESRSKPSSQPSNGLSSREQQVLRAAVTHYIATAEPVGSRTLADACDFKASPATIRNVLGGLDRAGLLYQPHTSAGRIPSDSGYRVYVDDLLTVSFHRRSLRFRQVLARETPKLTAEADLETFARLLATLSGCLALILLPDGVPQRLRGLQLNLLADRRLVVTVLGDHEVPRAIAVPLPLQLPPEELQSMLPLLTQFLNTELAGCFLSECADQPLPWSELDRQCQQYAEFLEQALAQLVRTHCRPSWGQLYISGLARVLSQPEFAALERVQHLVRLVEEERSALLALFADVPPSLHVKIGRELPEEDLNHCALVTMPCRTDRLLGTVALLGPTRMHYEQAIALTEAAATHLSAHWLPQ
ncbi:MAG: heat-inducible transcriptional repressor HrcA [Pseudanabaenaceae cyanobacterium]